MINKFSLAGKNAIVVDGADRLGQAIAQGLIQCNATVGIASPELKKLKQAAEAIKGETGRKIETFQIASDSEGGVKQLVQTVVEKMTTVDILVNSLDFNAKIPADFSVEEEVALFKINVKSAMMYCKEFAKIMSERKNGTIVNVSYIRSIRADIGNSSAYYTNKNAIDTITRTLAIELSPYNIKVNAVSPIMVPAALMTTQLTEPDLVEYIHDIQPECTEIPDNIVWATVFLANPATNSITGQIMYVNGETLANDDRIS